MAFSWSQPVANRGTNPITGALALLLVATLCAHATACRIPVFRYALERWEPGTFEAIVVHSAPLTPDQMTLLARLQQQTNVGSDGRVNLRVTTWMQVENTDDSTAQASNGVFPPLSAQEQSVVQAAKEPVILLRFPPSARGAMLAWSGPLNELSVQRVLSSPLRQQLVTRLLDGDSAVWVLVECGDAQRDDAAAELLEAELRRLEKAIELPALEELAAEEEFQANTSVPLRLGFSLVRLAKNDAEEEVLRSMLLASEPDLAEFDDPIVIPVYGRGRTYYALVGKGISPELIEDNGRFVCGDCSCQIKDQNPGVDLLLAANWEDEVQGSALVERDLPEVAGIGSLGLIDLGTVNDSSTAVEGPQSSSKPAPPSHLNGESTSLGGESDVAVASEDSHQASPGPGPAQSEPSSHIIQAIVVSLVAAGLIALIGSVILLQRKNPPSGGL